MKTPEERRAEREQASLDDATKQAAASALRQKKAKMLADMFNKTYGGTRAKITLKGEDITLDSGNRTTIVHVEDEGFRVGINTPGVFVPPSHTISEDAMLDMIDEAVTS